MNIKKTLAIFVLVASLTLAACSGEVEPAESPTVAPQQTSIVVEGRVEPTQWQTLTFGSSGVVDDILVIEGDQVEAGQVLATLEVAGIEIKQAELARARQELINAQQNLENLANNAQLAAAQARFEVSDLEYQLDQTRTLLDEENEKEEPDPILVTWYENSLVVLTEKLSIAQTQAEKLNGGITDPDQEAAARARLESAEAAVAAAESSLEPGTITAPFAGTVTRLLIKPGQMVSAGFEVMTLANLTNWVIKTENLTEIEIGQVSLGQTVTILLDAVPGVETLGSVAAISQQAEEKRGDITYTVSIVAPNLPESIRWGLTAAIFIGK